MLLGANGANRKPVLLLRFRQGASQPLLPASLRLQLNNACKFDRLWKLPEPCKLVGALAVTDRAPGDAEKAVKRGADVRRRTVTASRA